LAKKANDRKTPELHKSTILSNAWRQSIREVESLTDQYNRLTTEAANVKAKIDIARKAQKEAWDEMAAYKSGPQMSTAPPPLEEDAPAE
jgi:hypothetical protein